MRYPPRNKYKIRLYLYLAIITVSLGTSFAVFVSVIRPVFLQRLQYYGHMAANEAINNSISKVFSKDEQEYSDLILLDKQEDGTISALTTDTIKMNKIRAEVTNALEDELKNKEAEYIKLPLGSILGNELFAGTGPNISIKVCPVGIVSVDFYDEFESCGINQTKHTIYIMAKAEVAVITPSSKTSKEVCAKIPVAETVIVGTVPKYYGIDSLTNVVPEE